MDRLLNMKIFVSVAQRGSFSRAARAMGLANGTVTTCVHQLEEHLGVKLIDRSTRRQRLTEEGETYLRLAREALDAVARSEEETQRLAGVLRGRIHVELNTSMAQDLLWPQLPLFSQRYPEISVAVSLRNEPGHPIERAIDVALRDDPVHDANLEARPLLDTRFVLCGAPALADRLPAHPRELPPRLCLGLLSPMRQAPDPWRLHKGMERLELLPDGPLHFNTAVDALRAAQAGLGLVCVPELHARARVAAGELVRVYPDWSGPAQTVYLVMPRSRTGSAKVRAFSDFLANAV